MNPVGLLGNDVKSVSIEITTCCPLKCVYCERKIKNVMLEYDKFLSFKQKIDNTPSIERITFCGIGESLLHPNFYQMLEVLKGYKVTMITSGTIVVDFKKLDEIGNVDILIFSIDAVSKEQILNICGENYNYENLVLNLENLKNFLKQNNKKRRFITSIINCTINKNNIENIVEIMEFAHKYKFSAVHYSLPWGNYQMVKDKQNILKMNFKLAKEKADRYGIIMENPFDSYCCISHDHIMPYVDVYGNYYYCAYGLNKKEVLGNINSESIEDIRNQKDYEKYKSGQSCAVCDMTEFCKLRGKSHDR